MKNFFEAIADLFVNGLFLPLDALRALELENWWSANIINWIFMVICGIAIAYWVLQLKKYDKTEKEDKSISSHSYL